MAKTQKATKISSTGRLQSISLEEFSMSGINPETKEEFTSIEKYYCVIATKQRPLDIK